MESYDSGRATIVTVLYGLTLALHGITWVGLGRALNFACRDKLYSSLGVSEITQIKKTNPEFKTLSERRLSLEVYFYRNLRDHI